LEDKIHASNYKNYSLISTPSKFIPEWYFELFRFLPHVRTRPSFERCYQQSVNSEFVLHSELES